jgi:hypothetical protein
MAILAHAAGADLIVVLVPVVFVLVYRLARGRHEETTVNRRDAQPR